MTLSPGSRLGPYEIVAPLGAGGMGEVYRARDTKLHRDVAIKVLRPAVANDPDRVARFSREARVLASLNHPHIAQIHGFEDSGGIPALVMELVEGPTLADRIAQGAIPLAEALPMAQQIAEALEAAHEQGIVHRDLKPANIKVRDDGTVKVLDFGLAKALDRGSGAGDQGSVDAMDSPTISGHATEAGVILGTAAYMSPEQAKGRPVDKRADLWAFGAVLYEMLAGRRAFRGDGASDTIAHVLMEEPDWSALPAGTPGPIGTLLRRCLEKDRRRRLDSAAAARFAIEDALAAPAAETIAVSAVPSRRVAPVAIAALAGGALIASLVMWVLMRSAAPAPVLPSRFGIVLPPAQPLTVSGSERDLALSPDGRHIVYRSGGSAIVGSPLMVRAIDQLDAQPLVGITSAFGPFFSPDSRWIGFFENAELKKVSVTGGPAITLCRVSGGSLGASWGDDNTIVFAINDPGTGLWRVSAGGGEPTVQTKPDATQREKDHWFPSVLPGGRGVLFTIAAADQADHSQVAVLDLKTGQRKTLIRDGSQAEYIDASTGSGPAGHLIYAAAGTLRAVRFDLAKLEVLDDPVTVVERVRMPTIGASNYAVSRLGTLVYVPGGTDARTTPRLLVWVDRKGHETPIDAPLRGYGVARASPDGTRVAVENLEQDNDLWIWDLARRTLTRLTVDPGFEELKARVPP